MLMLCPLPISLYVSLLNNRKVNIKRFFNRLFYYGWILSSVRSCILQALQIILRQCQQHTQSLLLLSLLSFLLFWSDIGIIGVEVIACCSLDCLLQCFLWFLKQFLYITKYLFLVYLSVSPFDLTVYKCDLYDPYHPWYHQTPAAGRTRDKRKNRVEMSLCWCRCYLPRSRQKMNIWNRHSHRVGRVIFRFDCSWTWMGMKKNLVI